LLVSKSSEAREPSSPRYSAEIRLIGRTGPIGMPTTKRVNASILAPLKEALSLAFWYKRDLRAFLSTALPDVGVVSHLDWTDYKRNIVGQLVTRWRRTRTNILRNCSI